jgi:chemotaxis protein CheD
MNTIYVGVGEYATAKAPAQFIKTLALGSCVAVICLDTRNRTVGMLHVALPESSINQKRAIERPGMFADTGIPMLLEEMRNLGYKDDSRLIVKLAGGASIMDPNNTFNIGKRNILAVRKCLWHFKLGAISEDVGGNISRSVAVNLANGKVTISSPGRGEWEL